MDINVDGFTFLIKVVAMEMKENDRVQIILGRPFLATIRAIIVVKSTLIGITPMKNKDVWSKR